MKQEIQEVETVKFSAVQWISWLGATLVACVTLTAFAYNTFQTKNEADKTEARQMDGRREILDQIHNLDNKLDTLIRREN